MKRIIYILISLEFLVSCSIDTIKDVFETSEIEFCVVTSKAVEVNSANFEEFKVTALYRDGNDEHYKDEVLFVDVYEKNDAYFASPNKNKWPSDGSVVDFYAYYPYDSNLPGTITLTEEKKVLEGFTAAELLSNQVDFVSAIASGAYNKNGINPAVGLEFQHNLTQVEVRGRNTSDGYVCKVWGIIFSGIAMNGDFDFVTNEWTVDYDEKGTCGFIYDQPITLGHESISLMGVAMDGDKVVSDNAMLVPQTLTPWLVSEDPNNRNNGALISLLVQIRTVTGTKIYPTVTRDSDYINDQFDEYDLVSIPINEVWEAGTKYIYTWDIPRIGGYVYPGKADPDSESHDVFYAGDPIMGTQIRALTPIVAPWEGAVEELVPVPEPELGNNEADLIGTWNVDRMTLSVTKGDDDIQVLEMPSPQAVYSQGRLPEVLYSVEFDQNKMYTLNGGAEGEIISDDGTLCLVIDDVGVIEINDWSENQMSLYMKYVPQDDVIIEYQAYYLKEGATKEDLRDWEKQLEGVWEVHSVERITTAENGEVLSTDYVESYDEIVNTKDLVDDLFYVLTFNTPYEWHFNNLFDINGDPVISYTMLLNNTLALLVAVDEDNYTIHSLYNMDLISNTETNDIEMRVFTTVINDENQQKEYTELIYRKR